MVAVRKHLPRFIRTGKFTQDDRIAMARIYLEPQISAMERVADEASKGFHYSIQLYTGSDTAGFAYNCGHSKTLPKCHWSFIYSKINLNIIL